MSTTAPTFRTQAERVEAVIQALSDTMPGAAWSGPANHPQLQVGGVKVCLLEVASHIIDTLDGLT